MPRMLRGWVPGLVWVCLFVLAGGAADEVRNTEELRERIVAAAVATLGAPYRYGGTTTAGYDCSGLVWNLYRSVAGIVLPRTAKEQWLFVEKRTEWPPQAGDLVFFQEGGEIFHVGISLGDGSFVSALSDRPVPGVARVWISEPWWMQRYAGSGSVFLTREMTPSHAELRYTCRALFDSSLSVAGCGAGVILEFVAGVPRAGVMFGIDYGTIRSRFSIPVRLSLSPTRNASLFGGIHCVPPIGIAGVGSADTLWWAAPALGVSWRMFDLSLAGRKLALVVEASAALWPEHAVEPGIGFRFGLGVDIR